MEKHGRIHLQDVAACAGLALLFSLSDVINAHIFPLFHDLIPMAKDLGTATGIAALLIIAKVAMHRPFPLVTLKLACGFSCLSALGLCGIYFGSAAGWPLVVVVGAALLSVGSRTVVPLYACFPLVKLGFNRSLAILLVAQTIQYPLSAAARIDAAIPWVFAAVAPFAISWLAHAGGASEVLDHGKTPRLADLSIANPHSFLPFSHIVFLTFAMFNLATGCALTFLANEGVPQSTVFSILPPAILLAAWLLGKPCSANLMVKVSALLILLGFSVVPLAEASSPVAQGISTASTGLFAIGSSLFNVVFYLVLSETGRRNRYASVPLFAFGYASSRLGFIAGALVGQAMNRSDDAAIVVSTAATFVFAAYAILALGKIDFAELVERVRPIDLSATGQNVVERELEDQCRQASELFALTPRESEILALLAQGRSIAVIQEKLVVSKNTVKTHVKNIYLKLDVHSQQELIDAVRSL